MKQNDFFFSLIRCICSYAWHRKHKVSGFFFFFSLVTDMQILWKSTVGAAGLLIAKVFAVINGKWKLSLL